MKLKLSIVLLSSMLTSQVYAHSFNCNVKNVSNSSSTPDLVFITMNCKASSPHSSGTGNCTATTVSDDTLAIDASTELGKRYYSMALTALTSQKTTYISAYGTCPVESPSTPSVYSMKLSH